MLHCRNCLHEPNLDEVVDEGICPKCKGVLVEVEGECFINKDVENMIDLLAYAHRRTKKESSN